MIAQTQLLDIFNPFINAQKLEEVLYRKSIRDNRSSKLFDKFTLYMIVIMFFKVYLVLGCVTIL